jgi:hypothetical protein
VRNTAAARKRRKRRADLGLNETKTVGKLPAVFYGMEESAGDAL